MQKLLFAAALVFILISGCTEENTEPLPDGERYYPLEIGRTLTYRSDSIIFDDDADGNTMDTLSGFIREIVTDTFTGTDGLLAYSVDRSFRRTESEPWGNAVTHVLRRSEQFGYRKEGNLQFTLMRFPVRHTTDWKPTNLFDDQLEIEVGTENIAAYTNWAGSVVSLDESETIGIMSFDSVLTCLQADDDNEIERRFVMEKYATGVGLVFRSDTILDSRCKRLGDLEPCFGESWNEKGEKGYILRQEIISIN